MQILKKEWCLIISINRNRVILIIIKEERDFHFNKGIVILNSTIKMAN